MSKRITYQTVLKERMEENRIALKDIERSKPLWFVVSEMQSKYDIKFSSAWCDYDGINVFISNLTKREILIFLDEFFWSRNMKTTDPSFISGRMRIKYEHPEPVFGEGLRPALLICFEVKLDDTCRRVFDGFVKTEKYKWICD